MINDIYKEHDSQHYSDDWSNLKDKCSECYKRCEEMQKVRRMRFAERSPNNWQLEDLHLNPNPLN